ncbi:hypothetical protein OIU74_001793 [Salix koriyanagi]|uniref:Uncharacterized protein n=1 Tax=Salix koriyanagi TaxID=2511006 RepID=A0A9Q0X3M8_9ROSI|nr:hypothetical protein OIU74_001793 [Salix koriyanagi]
MGNDRCNIPCKPRYDITMSRRTRKPVMSVEEADQNPTAVLIISPDEESDAKDATQATEKVMSRPSWAVQETRVEDDENIESKLSGSKNSLGQHFKGEEKQLQLVTMKQAKEGIEGVKLKGMVGRYVKVLSHLIRVKRDKRINNGSRKKPLLRLPM